MADISNDFSHKVFTRNYRPQAGFQLPKDWYDESGGLTAVLAGKAEVPRIRNKGDEEKLKEFLKDWDLEALKKVAQISKTKKNQFTTILMTDGSQLTEVVHKRLDGSTKTSLYINDPGPLSGVALLLRAEKLGWNLDNIKLSGSADGIVKIRDSLQKEHERRMDVALKSMTDWHSVKLGEWKQAGAPVPAELDRQMRLSALIQDKLSQGCIPLSTLTTILHENAKCLDPRATPFNPATGKQPEPNFERIATLLGLKLEDRTPQYKQGPTVNPPPPTPGTRLPSPGTTI